jgi:hypothetical protein
MFTEKTNMTLPPWQDAVAAYVGSLAAPAA